jgi:hypothetical protein
MNVSDTHRLLRHDGCREYVSSFDVTQSTDTISSHNTREEGHASYCQRDLMPPFYTAVQYPTSLHGKLFEPISVVLIRQARQSTFGSHARSASASHNAGRWSFFFQFFLRWIASSSSDRCPQICARGISSLCPSRASLPSYWAAAVILTVAPAHSWIFAYMVWVVALASQKLRRLTTQNIPGHYTASLKDLISATYIDRHLAF